MEGCGVGVGRESQGGFPQGRTLGWQLKEELTGKVNPAGAGGSFQSRVVFELGLEG